MKNCLVWLLAAVLVFAHAGLAPGAEPTGEGAAEKTPEKTSEKGKEKSPAKPGRAAKNEEGKPEPSAAGPPSGAEVEWVKANLKEHIHGNISFSEDGTVTIDYDLRSKKEEHQDDFTPPISSKSMDVFRWSVYQEEHTIGSDYGVRISDKGAAFLNVWFVDDVEATAEYLQGINFSKRQVLALVFQGKGGKGIGNNYGTQCATFSGGGFQGGTPAVAETCIFNQRPKLGLKVKGGAYEALKDGKSKATAKYAPRSFSSGRLGFIWSGGVAGTMTSFSVKGKLDFPAMAREMRKRAGKS